jgi:hypothetical protein
LKDALLADAGSWQKEQFSHAYLLSVATHGGFTIASWNVDKDGVDATIRKDGLMVDIQLKCTQSPRQSRGDYVYDLDIPTFDKLRDSKRSAPGYLALIVVPEDINKWLTQEPEKLLLSCHGYWARIQDMPPASGSTKTAINLPRAQSLDVAALENMFQDSLNRLISGAIQGEAA